MSPNQQRAAADYLVEQFDISQRRAGRVLGRSRSTLRYRGKPHQEFVQHESGVDACAHQSYAPIFRRGIELCRQLRISAKRIREFFTRRNDARFGLQRRQELLHYLRQRRRSRMNHDIRSLAEDFRRVGRNRQSPGSVRRAHDFSKVAPDLGRIRINHANDFNGLLLSH